MGFYNRSHTWLWVLIISIVAAVEALFFYNISSTPFYVTPPTSVIAFQTPVFWGVFAVCSLYGFFTLYYWINDVVKIMLAPVGLFMGLILLAVVGLFLALTRGGEFFYQMFPLLLFATVPGYFAGGAAYVTGVLITRWREHEEKNKTRKSWC